MLYLYHKKIHIGCIIAFVLLSAMNAAVLISQNVTISLSRNAELILSVSIPLVLYLISMLIPTCVWHILCKISPIFAKKSGADIESDGEIKKAFMRSRFIPLILTDYLLLIIFFELLSQII